MQKASGIRDESAQEGRGLGHESRQRAVRIRKGNRQAFERLFRAHYEALYRFALGYVEHPRVAEDLVQDVFFDLWQGRRSLDVKRSLKAYLYGMTRNRALKHLRRQRVRARWTAPGAFRETVAAAVTEQADQVLRRKELEREAEQAIATLPERRRQIFLLSRHHDLTYAEIAEALDISIKTVETQMSRALKFLRERLAFLTAP